MTTSTSPLLAKANDALKQVIGFEKFRLQQEQAIARTLADEDALVIMPTGGGKSLCYQIPALVKDGTCLVISPLISLMKDQAEALKQNGVSAAYLNSTLSIHQQQQVEEDFMTGKLKPIFDHLKQEIPYNKLRLALVMYKKSTR